MQHLQKPRGEGVPSQVLEDLRELAARSRCLTQVLSFHTLAHSFALTKNSTLLFSIVSALFAQNTRGWGMPVTLTNHDNLLFRLSRPTMNLFLRPLGLRLFSFRGPAMPEAVIVSAIRTPVGRAYKGSLRATRPDDLAALAIKEALARVPGLDAKEIDDVILGCAMPEGEQGMTVARIAALRAGLPVETSAMTINRFCSSGLQAIALAAERIRSGSTHVIL